MKKQYLLMFFHAFLHISFVSEQMRQTERTVKRSQRDLERDRNQLEREEKKIVNIYT